MKRPRHSQGNKAFTLVELLAVISIMVILAFFSLPALTSLLGSGKANQNISQLSDILEVAREYAVANNTYVWVAFYPATGSGGVSSLSVAVLASNDGTDPASSSSAPWGNASCSYGTVPNSEISLVNKITTLQQISLQNAGTYTVNSLPATPAVTSTANSVASNSHGFFSMTLPGGSSLVNFTQGIEYLPTGQSRNGSSPANVIDLDVDPQMGNVSQLKNAAVVRINGLTGEPVVYRN
jgi:prepilin-type N-terminal cleavage/methylation domain-containing protein